MSTNHQPIPVIDGALFIENVNRFPPEERIKFAGQHVAWSLDGTKILASAEEEEEVDKKLLAAGISPSQVVHGYIERMDGVSLL